MHTYTHTSHTHTHTPHTYTPHTHIHTTHTYTPHTHTYTPHAHHTHTPHTHTHTTRTPHIHTHTPHTYTHIHTHTSHSFACLPVKCMTVYFGHLYLLSHFSILLACLPGEPRVANGGLCGSLHLQPSWNLHFIISEQVIYLSDCECLRRFDLLNSPYLKEEII